MMNLFSRRKHPAVVYDCDFCKKSFITKYELKNHARTHSAERKFSCHECGKGFIQPGALRVHIKVIHTLNKILVEVGQMGLKNESHLVKILVT